MKVYYDRLKPCAKCGCVAKNNPNQKYQLTNKGLKYLIEQLNSDNPEYHITLRCWNCNAIICESK